MFRLWLLLTLTEKQAYLMTATDCFTDSTDRLVW